MVMASQGSNAAMTSQGSQTCSHASIIKLQGSLQVNRVMANHENGRSSKKIRVQWKNFNSSTTLHQLGPQWIPKELQKKHQISIPRIQGTTPCKDKWNVFNFDYKKITNYHIIKRLRTITKVLETIFFLGVIFWKEKKIIYLNSIIASIMKWLRNFKEKKSSMLQYILKMWTLNGMESIDHLQQGHKMNLHQRYKMSMKTCNHNIMCKNLKNGLQMFIKQDLLVWWTYLSIRQSHFDQANGQWQ